MASGITPWPLGIQAWKAHRVRVARVVHQNLEIRLRLPDNKTKIDGQEVMSHGTI